MTFSAVALWGLAFVLAYVNGANDVSKGVATLVGTGVTDYKRAIAWGTGWTALGGLVGATFATAMVTAFGKGLIALDVTQTLGASVATLVGASAWVLIATRTGLPVSTTHAILGSLTGVATVAYGLGGLQWSAFLGKLVLPLLLTPLLSLGIVAGLLKLTKPRSSGYTKAPNDCLCVDVTSPQLAFASTRSQTTAPSLHIVTDTAERCAVQQPDAARITLDHMHWLTAGAASFARGMNDAPKIVALIAAASALEGTWRLDATPLFAFVTSGMVVGSLVAGTRVTRVLAENVTPMDHREGFLANLTTAVLVTAGATLGLPMSTTHVSSGGIIGAGVQRGSLNVQTLRHMIGAWVVTLPAAAALGIGALWLGRLLP